MRAAPPRDEQVVKFAARTPIRRLMSNVNGLSGSPPGSTYSYDAPSGPMTVATALAALRRHATSVAITDSVQNILKNLDSLQGYAGKISDLSTADNAKNLQVTAAQYAKDGAALALWGADDGQTVSITGVKAASAAALAASAPSYVTSISVSDVSLNLQNNLDSLQTLATDGILHEIVHTGSSSNITITADQLTADATALGKIRNHAYTLAITHATVSDTLGLDSAPALSTNAKVKSIAIIDTTDAISDHLDALQQVGLRLKSLTQSDATNPLTVTADQTKQDKVVLGKILTSYDLAVINASAAQLSALSNNTKVVTIGVKDTAANLSRKWTLLQQLSDSLTSVEVNDDSNDITLTSDQLAASDSLLSKFTDTSDKSYKLAVTAVSAGTALTVSGLHNVDTVDVTDNGDGIASSLADLQTINGNSQLKGITLTSPKNPITLDASLLVGDPLTATQTILDKIKGGNYSLAATGAAASDLSSLADNSRVVSVAVSDSSDNLVSAFDTLAKLGHRLTTIDQTDDGTAFDLTQTQLDSRSSVLAKITGGYTANLTDVKANKAAADAANLHVASLSVSDTGANLLAQWTALRSLGANLTSLSKSDDGALTLSANKYQLGTQDSLLAKFDSGTTFSVYNATVAQAQTMADNDAVTQIDVSDESATIVGNLAALATLATGGKLASITNTTPSQSLALAASDLSDAQPVLDLIKAGNYTLSLSGVGVADAKDLVAANHRIKSMAVTGDASGIAANLADLTTLGSKVNTITQTDGTALDLTGTVFEQNAGALGKILGGYLANLSAVSAAKAAAFAANTAVKSLQVSDTGSHLASAWATLDAMGDKLTSVTQSDSSTLQLTVGDWLNGQDLSAKFSTDVAVSVSGADVAQVGDLADDSAVNAIQVSDSAAAVAASLADLAAQSKVTQVALTDPTVAMKLTAQVYSDASDLLGVFKNGQYKADLSHVAAADAATFASDTHVSSMDVSDTSAAISSNFAALAAATKLKSIALSNEGGTVTLTSAQILAGSGTLAKFSTDFALAATGVALADLADVASVPQVSSISVSDTAAHVSANFSDLLALGGTLSHLHLTDSSPVLSLAETDWSAGASALGKLDGSYQVDLTDAAAGDASTLDADSTVRHVGVSDTASNIANQWDTLVSLYASGKLTGLGLSDANQLSLTSDQQTSGAAMIADLLPDEDIQTA